MKPVDWGSISWVDLYVNIHNLRNSHRIESFPKLNRFSCISCVNTPVNDLRINSGPLFADLLSLSEHCSVSRLHLMCGISTYLGNTVECVLNRAENKKRGFDLCVYFQKSRQKAKALCFICPTVINFYSRFVSITFSSKNLSPLNILEIYIHLIILSEIQEQKNTDSITAHLLIL